MVVLVLQPSVRMLVGVPDVGGQPGMSVVVVPVVVPMAVRVNDRLMDVCVAMAPRE